MPLYCCEDCGCVENTALGFYWLRTSELWPEEFRGKQLCSECGPLLYADGEPSDFGKWHGRFEKKSATGYLIDNWGFLWPPDMDLSRLPKDYRIVGKVEPL